MLTPPIQVKSTGLKALLLDGHGTVIAMSPDYLGSRDEAATVARFKEMAHLITKGLTQASSGPLEPSRTASM